MAAALCAAAGVGCLGGSALNGFGSASSARAAVVAASPRSTTAPGRASTGSVSQPDGSPNRCAGNQLPQLVLVSVSAQHAWLCARTRTVYDTPVTTGRATSATRPPTGRFTVQAKVRDAVLFPGTGE